MKHTPHENQQPDRDLTNEISQKKKNQLASFTKHLKLK